MHESTFIQTQRSKQRRTTLILLVTCILLGLNLLRTYRFYSFPTDGIAGTPVDEGFQIDHIVQPQRYPQLHIGDIITKIDDKAVAQTETTSIGGKHIFIEAKDGDTFTYTIKRGQDEFPATITLYTISLKDFLTYRWVHILDSFLFIALGVIVAIRRPFDITSFIFWWFTLAVTPQFLYFERYLPLSNTAASAIYISNYLLFELLAPIGAIHLFTYFPKPNFSKKVTYSILGLFYGAWAILGGTYAWYTFSGNNNLLTGIIPFRDIFYSVSVLTAVALSIYVYKKTKTPIERLQLRWPLWVIMFIIGPEALIDSIVKVITGSLFFPDSVTYLIIAFLPIAYFIAITKYKLFSIDKLINRSLVYGVATILTTGIFIVASIILSSFVSGTFTARLPEISSFISAAIAIIVFNPLKNSVQRIIDRLFYKQKLQAEAVLQDMSEKISYSTTYQEVATLIINQLPARLGITSIWLFVKDPLSDAFFDIRLKTTEDVQTQQLSEEIDRYYNENDKESQGGPQLLVPENLTLEFEQELKKNGVSIIYALKQEDTRIGYLAVGEKISGLPFTIDEIHTLEAISYQTALALKHAQDYDELLQEKQKSDIIFHTISEGLLETDSSNTIIAVNDTLLNTYGIAKDALIDKPIADVFSFAQSESDASPPSLAETIKEIISERLPYRGLHTFAFLAPDKDPISIPAALYINPLFKRDGTYDGLFITMYNRSEEEALIAVKDSFITILTHELQTPLTIIKGALAKIPMESFSSREKWVFKLIYQSAQQLSERTKQITDIGSLQTGHAVVGTDLLELNSVLNPLIEKATATPPNESVTYSVETSATDGIIVLGDQQAIETCVTILIENAKAFTTQGTIYIRTHLSRSINSLDESTQNPRFAIIEVSDTGPGIEQSTQDQLFTPFIQQGGSLERNQIKGGLGLGLYQFKLLVEKMNGNVWFTSKVNFGSSFFFSLAISKK